MGHMAQKTLISKQGHLDRCLHLISLSSRNYHPVQAHCESPSPYHLQRLSEKGENFWDFAETQKDVERDIPGFIKVKRKKK